MDIKYINKKSQYILRRVRKEDAEDIKQDVFLELLEKNPDIKHNGYYSVVIRNEMLEFIRKEINLKKNEAIYAQLIGFIVPLHHSPFNDLLYKQLKGFIKKNFVETSKSARKQLELLDYLMVDGNEENSAKDIKQDLKFNNCDTAKANVRHIRLKLDEVKKLLKNDDNS